MSQRKARLSGAFFIAFCLALLPFVCEGGGKSRPMGQSIEKKEESKPRLIVLPLQPQEGQAYDGIGLGFISCWEMSWPRTPGLRSSGLAGG